MRAVAARTGCAIVHNGANAMASRQSMLTDNQKLVGWCLVGLIAAVLVATSLPDRGIREGHRGSYLGAPGRQAEIAPDRVNALANRAGGQNF